MVNRCERESLGEIKTDKTFRSRSFEFDFVPKEPWLFPNQSISIPACAVLHFGSISISNANSFVLRSCSNKHTDFNKPHTSTADAVLGIWVGSGILQSSNAVPVPVLIQSSIVHAILQRGLGATFATLSPHELAWCCVIVELPHHKGGLGITPLPAGMAAFYSATAHLVSWLGSLPHACEWVAGQNLADPTSWNSSALQTLKQLHDNLLTQRESVLFIGTRFSILYTTIA